MSPLHLVTVESLGYCLCWNHRLKATGDRTSFTLQDGRTIESRHIRGAINRILTPATFQLAAAAPEDRGYGAQEIFSFYVSWLNTLPKPILNPPTPQGLCGRSRHISEWIWLAIQAGFKTPKYRMSSKDLFDGGKSSVISMGRAVTTAVVVGDAVFGAVVPEDVARSCVRLAELAGVATLGIDLYQDENSKWTFAAATPMPDFRLGGQPLLGKLADILIG